MGIFYLLIALLATVIGGMTGIGGGVIIKPALDAFSSYDVASINILSSVTIFSMAAVSCFRNVRKGFKINKNLVILAIGAIVGGLIGKELLFIINHRMEASEIVIMQSAILAFLLMIVLFKHKIKTHHVKNMLMIAFIGMLLGVTSSFLGVGGGPINVFVLHLFLEMDTKELSISSIFIILLSQLSKLSSIALTSGYGLFTLDMLVYMVPAGIAGGIIGSHLLHKVNIKHLNIVFNVVVFLIILLNIYNILNNIWV